MHTTIDTPTPHLTDLPEPIWYGDSLFEFLVPAAASGGAISIFRATLAAGFSPPRHVHTREDEAFIVKTGAVTFWIDGRELVAGPGAAVYMPRGVPHTFRVDSDGAVMLGVMTPGDFESLFRELGVPALKPTLPPAGAVPFDVARVMAAQEERGTRVVGPPLAPRDSLLELLVGRAGVRQDGLCVGTRRVDDEKTLLWAMMRTATTGEHARA